MQCSTPQQQREPYITSAPAWTITVHQRAGTRSSALRSPCGLERFQTRSNNRRSSCPLLICSSSPSGPLVRDALRTHTIRYTTVGRGIGSIPLANWISAHLIASDLGSRVALPRSNRSSKQYPSRRFLSASADRPIGLMGLKLPLVSSGISSS